ncbi:MAG: WYL domain-containing protein [Alcaligenaceae bacterium]|nr:WYL domain-containing protein [Alcaligenaceae bacterium]
MPLGLAQQGERLYLVCRFKGYNDNRSLAVHRIKKAKVFSHTFEYPSNFSLKEYDNNGTFLISHGRRIVLRFNFKKPLALYLTETPLSKDQTIEEHEDYLTITATVIDSIMLTRWLNSFGEDVWDIRKEEVEAV